MHLLLSERGSEPFLIQELRRAFQNAAHEIRAPGLVVTDFALQMEAPPILVFARQLLPEADEHHAVSINEWSAYLFAAITARLPGDQPWHLHIVPHYGTGAAGQNRCRLIRESLCDLLRRKRRHMLRSLTEKPAPFAPAHSLVQLLLLEPGHGFLSVAPAPAPHQLRRVLWPFPKGEIDAAVDKAAPSRAFAKLLEAEQRLGRRIAPGETCADLGASPGSWSYVALKRGARVIAVDRARLRADLMSHPRLTFRKGDAFKFEPPAPVDWLLCDVIAAPMRSVDLLLRWVRQKQAARFVVTIKFKGTEDYGLLEQVKHALPPLCDEFFLTRLCSNKNEVCAFGVNRSGVEPGWH